MQNENTYKYLSIVLAIIAIVFAVLYFAKPSEPVSETVSDTFTDVKTCRDAIAAWQQNEMNQPTTTTESRNELNKILSDCKTAIENAQQSF